MFSLCWLVTWIFWRLSHKDNPLRNLRHLFSTSKWRFRGPELRQIYLYSIANITSAASSLKFRKYLLSRSYFATGICKAATETQSIGIHDVYLFNSKLAMHYRAIFKYGWFPEGDFVAVFWSIFLVIKAKQDKISYFFRLMYCVNDFFDRFHHKIEVIGQRRWEWKLHQGHPTMESFQMRPKCLKYIILCLESLFS